MGPHTPHHLTMATNALDIYSWADRRRYWWLTSLFLPMLPLAGLAAWLVGGGMALRMSASGERAWLLQGSLLRRPLRAWRLGPDGAPVGARFEFDNLSTCGTLAGGGGGGGGGGGELDEIYFIPAAARAAGSGSSFFVTDVDVNNSGRWTATYKFLWLPRDTNNAEPAESGEFTIGPGVSIRYKDVLAQVFNVGGGATAVGALAILSDSSDLLFMSRTFNSSDEGTFGQAIVGIEEDDLIRAGERRRVLFMTENDEFRSNPGLHNGPARPTRAALTRLPNLVSISTNWGKVAWMLNCSGSPM